jgi:hypothetical protein
VYVPLPPIAMKSLAVLNTNDNGRFFSTGNAKLQTARANWSRYLETLFVLAKIKGGHPSPTIGEGISARINPGQKNGAFNKFEELRVFRAFSFRDSALSFEVARSPGGSVPRAWLLLSRRLAQGVAVGAPSRLSQE